MEKTTGTSVKRAVRNTKPPVTITASGPVTVIEQDFLPPPKGAVPIVKDAARAAMVVASAPVTPTETESKLHARAADLLSAAERAVIDSDDSVEKGVDLAKMIRVAKSKLEDERKNLVDPFNKGVKAINDRFRPFTDKLDDARQVIDMKVIAFKRKQMAEAAAAAEKARKEAEASLPPPAEDMFPETPAVPSGWAPAALPKVGAVSTRGSLGSGSLVQKFDFRVVNIKLVPAEYLAVDGPYTRKAINGPDRLTEIAGLEIFDASTLTVR